MGVSKSAPLTDDQSKPLCYGGLLCLSDWKNYTVHQTENVHVSDPDIFRQEIRGIL